MPFENVKNIVSWFVKPLRPQTQQYWRVVLLCFVAASTFWLLNALNKSYTTQTTYPIKFVYNENQLIPTKPLPEEVSINVVGRGWKLLRKALRVDVKPAEIYIRSLPSNKYLLGSSLRPALVNAMDGLELRFVVTDTLHFDFDTKVRRTVALALEPNQNFVAPKHALVAPVRLLPDTVTFVGPATMVNKIPDPLLLKLPTQNLTASANIEVPLEYEFKELIQVNEPKVIVAINIEGLLQEERQAQPVLVNMPEDKEVTIQPSTVLLRYQFLEDSAASLHRDSFNIGLDYAKYNPADSTIIPDIIRKPAGVRKVTVMPGRVKVILK